jgi:hypothetical protein
MRFQVFRQIVSMPSVTLPVAGTLTNFDPLIADGYAGKTGSQLEASRRWPRVTDNGPAGNPLTFTDVVSAGLKIDPVLTPSGPCTIVGPVVTCTITGLTTGTSAPVDIVATHPRARSRTR